MLNCRWVVIPLLVLASGSFAYTEQCASVLGRPEFRVGLYAPNIEQDVCYCGPELKSMHKPKAPYKEGFRLVGACNINDKLGTNEEYGAAYGMYYFVGDVIISGSLIREDDVIGRFDLGSFKFDYSNQYTNKKLKPPDPSNESPCWKTVVTLKINTLVVLNGQTDEAGWWPMQYEVLSIGKYKKCE